MGRTMKNRRNANISLLKLVSACFVVFIHVSFPGSLGDGADCVARFAVPVFLLISGYYSYGADVGALRKRLKKIVFLMVFSNGVYLLWNAFQVLVTQGSLREYCAGVFTVERLARFIFMGDNPFSTHLWYLSAIAFVYAVMIGYREFYTRSDKPNYMPLYIVAVCGFMFQIAFGVKALGIGMDVNYMLYRYCLFFALPLFALGLFLHEYRERIMECYRFTRKKAVMLILIGFILSLIQWFGIGKVEMPLGMFLVVIHLFLLAINADTAKVHSHTVMTLIGCTEICSTVVYIIHPLINRITGTFQSQVPLFDALRSMEDIYPLFVMLASVIIGYCIAIVVYCLRRTRPERTHLNG